LKLSHLGKIDSKGRIVLPHTLREALGLTEGMNILIIADLDLKEVKLIPFKARIAEFTLTFSDEPGALAKTASLLAEYGVNLLSSHSVTIERGAKAEWYALGDLSQCKHTVEELERELKRSGLVNRVEIRQIKEA
jgi:AbrB family looped-hinge helix DNA binding protein